MNFTDHYSLQKPISEEKYDVNVSNMNMDLIDSALNRLELQKQEQDNLLATNEALNSEITRATEKENELLENINNETTRAENSENEIINQLDSEITRAMQAEDIISSDLKDHIISSSAHNDIRLLISGLTTRLNSLADSDDTTLDQLSEIVAYIKNNKSLIDGITTSKVSVSDIIDNLTSTVANKPLSGKQGKVLKDLIDALTTAVGNKVDKISGKGLSANDYTTAEKNKLSGIAFGAEVNVQSDWNSTDTANDAYIKNKPTSMPASDVSSWAKAANKPTYTKSEIGLGNVPNVVTNDQAPTFTQATTRANILSGEKLSIIFGKIMKWFTDLKTVAFTGSYNDLSNKPTIPTVPSVGNGTVTIKQAGTQKGTFTMNQSGATTIELTDNNTTYSNFVKSGSGAKAGLVPSPGTTAGTTKYLREDGTWVKPPDTNTTYSNMTGATVSATGKAGLVPAPAAGKQTSFLRGDGAWANVVTGVKGNKESAYRTGNVNITPANIGALASDGNAASATKATQDGDGNVIADTYVPKNESRNVILLEYIAKSINTSNYISANSATLNNAILCGNNNQINKSDTGAPTFNAAILSGQNNLIESGYSSAILGGAYNTIKGGSSNAAIIAGNNITCLSYQIGTGHYNDDSKATAGKESGTGTGTAFYIGNGTSSAKSNAIRGDYNGKLWCKSAYSATGADYAELFEWQDGNPDDEDRRGYFVTMDGDEIRKAQPGDWILGIVSANPCVLGNTDTEWHGQFLKDEFGAFLTEEFTEIVTNTRYVPDTDEDGNSVLDENGVQQEIPEEYEEEITGTRYVLNPDYDPDAPYVDRMSRPEWDAVGMMGVLAVYDDGTCEVNGFCSCGDNGIATASDSGYRVIKRVNDNIVKVVFR